ncbi:MAG: hypothetical protein RI895_642 [Actinomycetota bacterium]
MSRLLYQAELPRLKTVRKHGIRAPCQNRTDDLFLTKEVRYHCAKGASLFLTDTHFCAPLAYRIPAITGKLGKTGGFVGLAANPWRGHFPYGYYD